MITPATTVNGAATHATYTEINGSPGRGRMSVPGIGSELNASDGRTWRQRVISRYSRDQEPIHTAPPSHFAIASPKTAATRQFGASDQPEGPANRG